MPEFAHLHCHTQYSLLDGASAIDKMLQKTQENEMNAVAITDHGNMFGAFDFFNQAAKHNIKPIIGCEFYVVEDRHKQKFDKGQKDKRHHQLILAKNAKGYQNLSKLCSLGYIEGYYAGFPRIDKELIRQYSEGLIATTCCLAAEIPQTFLQYGEEAAEQCFLEWWNIFGDDYYIEIQRHSLQTINEQGVNEFLVRMAGKYGVKMIATNDSHYVDQEDWNAHDTLLCINTGDVKATPMAEKDAGFYRFVTTDGQIVNATAEEARQKYSNDPLVKSSLDRINQNRFKPRFGFENDQFYFKTKEEMAELFKDIPDAIENTLEIVEKIETPDLKRDILLPHYKLPEGFRTMDEYLEHLTFEGAKERYGGLTADVTERINHELGIIQDMGFSGYFLIVQDFIRAAKDLGVWVGPGRGSSAGSVVAYTTGITNVEPLRHDLIFERFLNPERQNMPDIDIDFDDDGRQKVIDYVIDKYGKNQVAHIITYGRMAAKSAVRDVGRVLEYPLPDTDKLAKMVPEKPGMTLKDAYEENEEFKGIREQEDTQEGQLLKMSDKIEGSIRNRGLHAAGIIIAPDDITNYIPVCTSKETDLWVTQFDGNYVEDAGLLKMDFLGLKTLTIARDAVANVKQSKGVDIDLKTIPLDDEKTLELFQKGETIGTFQFESDGMRGWLQQLKPSGIKDLIAMNALYRPGPMDNIPSFISRKHGKEETTYPHPWLEEVLEPTYGILVYQEQIMQCAQIIGGFTLGRADVLRKAMGKKKKEVMQKMKDEFVEGAREKGVDGERADQIFQTMEKFADYGFPKAHATAYSLVAYQVGYLKAYFPAEFMASLLTHNMNDIDKIQDFLVEANRMGIQCLGPDINESGVNFQVNRDGQIRFAMSAIKGVGEAAVEAIVEERDANGSFTSIYDVTKRVNLQKVKKNNLETLAKAGAFDCFEGVKRAQYFQEVEKGTHVLDKAVRFGNQYQSQAKQSQNSLFGESLMVDLAEPSIPDCEEWPLIEKLKAEKEVTGMYLSGHPLDDYKMELNFTTCCIADMDEFKGMQVNIGGLVSEAIERMDKKGNPFGIFHVEDFSGSTKTAIFGEDYLSYKHLLEEGTALFIEGKYSLRKNTEDHYELRVNNMMLLKDVRDKYSSSLELRLSLDTITDELIGQLRDVVQKQPGKDEVAIKVDDSENEHSISFSSPRYKVTITDELCHELDKMGLHYSLNGKNGN